MLSWQSRSQAPGTVDVGCMYTSSYDRTYPFPLLNSRLLRLRLLSFFLFKRGKTGHNFLSPLVYLSFSYLVLLLSFFLCFFNISSSLFCLASSVFSRRPVVFSSLRQPPEKRRGARGPEISRGWAGVSAGEGREDESFFFHSDFLPNEDENVSQNPSSSTRYLSSSSASSSYSMGVIFLFDLNALRCIGWGRAHAHRLISMSFDPSGSRLATMSSRVRLLPFSPPPPRVPAQTPCLL